MKVGVLIIGMALILGSAAAVAQPLDTLKIKAEADSLKIIADSLRNIWQLEDALRLYDSALNCYRQIGDRDKEAKALHGLGTVNYYLSNYKEALQNWADLLNLNIELGNRKGESSALNNIGMIYDDLGEYASALEYYFRSLEIDKTTDNKKGQALTLNNIGCTYDNLSEYQKALDYLQQSLELKKIYCDPGDVGGTLLNMGIIYDRFSDYPKALDYYDQAYKILEMAGDKGKIGTVLHNIGVIYVDLSDYHKALDYYQASLAVRKEVGDRQGESMTLNNIGVALKKLGYDSEALPYYIQSLEICQAIGDKSGQSYALLNIGIANSVQNQMDEALAFFQKSLDVATALKDEYIQCLIWASMGRAYLKQSRFSESQTAITNSLSLALELNTKDQIATGYELLGDYYEQQSLDSAAAGNYSLSLKTAEEIRCKLKIESQSSSYAAGISQSYEKMVLSLLKQGRIPETYNYCERSRARSFLDLLASGHVKVGKSKHEEFLAKDREYEKQQQELEEQIQAVSEDTAKMMALRGKLEGDWGQVQELVEEKKQYEPELASMVSVNPLTLPEVQNLLDKETTLLEYFLTEKQTLFWLITRRSAQVFQVDVGGDSLKKLVMAFRDSIENYGNAQTLARQLYRILLTPAASQIKTEKLIIVPHGILHYLPFQALPDEKGKYLLEQYQISYLPSASVMKYLIPKRRPKGTKLLALGNPKTDREGYGAIPLSENEVKGVGGLYRQNQVLIGTEATEVNFRKLAPDYDVLHLACHTDLNAAYPLFSALLLAPDSTQDGELDVHEIFNLDLHADLVVLSGCQTAIGHLTNGDELVGLSRAFIYAGTPSIVSSLWRVEDESTAYLMQQFYGHWKNHNKAQALRQAQLKTREKFPQMRSWASFVLIGDEQ